MHLGLPTLDHGHPVTWHQVSIGLACKWLNRVGPSPAARGQTKHLALSGLLQQLHLAAAQVPFFSSLLPSRPLVNVRGSDLAGIARAEAAQGAPGCCSWQSTPQPLQEGPCP